MFITMNYIHPNSDVSIVNIFTCISFYIAISTSIFFDTETGEIQSLSYLNWFSILPSISDVICRVSIFKDVARMLSMGCIEIHKERKNDDD